MTIQVNALYEKRIDPTLIGLASIIYPTDSTALHNRHIILRSSEKDFDFMTKDDTQVPMYLELANGIHEGTTSMWFFYQGLSEREKDNPSDTWILKRLESYIEEVYLETGGRAYLFDNRKELWDWFVYGYLPKSFKEIILEPEQEDE